jgi:glutamate racemase
VEVKEKACPLLVPLVEEGWVEHPVTEEVAQIYLKEAFADGFRDADVLVLGCTHYPLIKPVLRRAAPDHVAIVDSAHSTASVVARLMRDTNNWTDPDPNAMPELKFFATDSVEKFRRLGPRFLGHPVESVEHVDLKE